MQTTTAPAVGRVGSRRRRTTSRCRERRNRRSRTRCRLGERTWRCLGVEIKVVPSGGLEQPTQSHTPFRRLRPEQQRRTARLLNDLPLPLVGHVLISSLHSRPPPPGPALRSPLLIPPAMFPSSCWVQMDDPHSAGDPDLQSSD